MTTTSLAPEFRTSSVAGLLKSIHAGDQPLPILADALQDAGYADERVLTKLRRGQHVPYLTSHTPEQTAALVAAIDGQLGRLDAGRGANGIVAVAEPSLPAGWVRVYDGSRNAWGPADAILTALEEVQYDRYRGFELAWNALGEFAIEPDNSQDWPEELFETEQLEEGTPNDEPNTLIIVATNAGVRFAAGPHGTFTCALGTWLAAGDLADTREEAIESCEFAEGGAA